MRGGFRGALRFFINTNAHKQPHSEFHHNTGAQEAAQQRQQAQQQEGGTASASKKIDEVTFRPAPHREPRSTLHRWLPHARRGAFPHAAVTASLGCSSAQSAAGASRADPRRWSPSEKERFRMTKPDGGLLAVQLGSALPGRSRSGATAFSHQRRDSGC